MGDQSSTIQRRSWLDDQGEGGSDSAFPWYVLAVRAAACLFGLWHIATNLFLNEPGLWQNAIHVGGFALLAALLNPFSRRFFNRPLAILVDLIFGLAILAAALWVAFAEHGLYARTLAKTGQAWQFTAIDWIAGFVVIFGAIELTRRLTGWIIPILVLFALGYILFLGELSPGIFRAASLPVNDVLFRSLYNDEGMFGIITTISSTNITLFMIFGGFLMVSGASDFVIEAAKIVARRMRGGAAFVAVIASALTGTITGSAVANTASTGVLTIPLMKANGFRARFAAGVEASASTGGQLMPPVMGAGAFVMAASTGIAYAKIVAVSIIPALLYFLAVAFIVRIEAVKHKIKTEASMEIDRSKLTAGALNFILPLAVMTAMLINGFTPSYSASTAIAVLIVASWFTARPIGIRRAVRALTLGVGTATMTALLLAAVGLINNAVTTSGLANALALMIVQWSQGSLVIAIALIALASLILGMGLPVTAAYIVLSILAAPALAGILADRIVVDQLVQGITDPVHQQLFLLVDHPLVHSIANGLTRDEAWQLMRAIPFEIAVLIRPSFASAEQLTLFLLTAHLIIFWLSQDSNVTPPVCLAAFVAAGIAKSPPMASGFEAWKISKALYIVPLMFAYTPIIGGDLSTVLWIGLFALFGLYAFTALIQYHGEARLSWWQFAVLAAAMPACFIPVAPVINLAGALGVVLVAGFPWMMRKWQH